MTDEQVLARVMAGKRHDFGILVERHLPAARAVAYAHLGNRPEVDDAVQDAFIQAYQRLGELRDPAKFGPWLASIARNCCRAIVRGPRAKPLTAEQEAALPATFEDPARKELRELLQARIHSLEPPYREALLLHYYGGMSVADIAGAQNISADAVKKRLQRGRAMLSEHMIADLRGLLEPAESTEDVRRRIMRGIAAVPAGWTAGSAGAAAGAMSVAIGSVTKIGLAAGFIGVLFASVWVTLGEERSDPSQETAAVVAEDSARNAVEPAQAAAEAADPPPATASAAETDTALSVNEETVKPASIAGIVVDQHGQPMPGMGVAAADGTRAHQELHPASPTGDDGRFRIEGLEPGRYELYVARDPRSEPTPFEQAPIPESARRAEQVWVTDAGQHITGQRLVFERPEEVIAGRVMDTAGEPIADARVSARASGVGVRGSAESGADGRFEITGLADAVHQVNAQHEDYAYHTVRDVSAGERAVEIVLDRYGGVEGQVFDAATRRPIEQFAIGGMGGGSDDEPRELAGLTMARFSGREISDPEGRYKLDDRRPGSRVRVYASAEGYAPAQVVSPPIPEGKTVTGVDLYLQPGEGVIEGRVVDERGRPLPGADVYWDVMDIHSPASPDGTQERNHIAAADEDGAFRAGGLGADEYRLVATHADYMPGRAQVQVEKGASAEAEIVLEPGGTITGTVLRNGEPVSGMEVRARLTYVPTGRRSVTRSATTNASGEYAISPAPVGEVRVQLGEGRDAQEARVNKGRTTVVNFNLTGETAIVEGLVTIDGAPPTSGQVTVSLPPTLHRSAITRHARLVDGSYRVTELPAGANAEVEVRIQAEPGAGEYMRDSATVALRGGRTARQDFEFERGARLAGRIRGAGEFEFVGVMLAPEHVSIAPFDTDAREDIVEEDANRLRERDDVIAPSSLESFGGREGSYSILGLSPGAYTLLTYRVDAREIPRTRPILGYATYSVVVEPGETEYELDIEAP